MDEHTNFREASTFYDDIHYPRGFSKHGDFTIREAEALHFYGRSLAELSSGNTAPETDDEQHFVDVCSGAGEAQTYLEKLWLKYQSKIRTKHIAYGLSTAAMPVSSRPDPEYDFL